MESNVTTEDRRFWAEKVLEFVRSIGINAKSIKSKGKKIKGEFLPNIMIVNGGIEVNLDEVFPGDIIHEVGHIAILPQQFRGSANGNLKSVQKEMQEYFDKNVGYGIGGKESSIIRGIIECDDSSATAWQYAAAVKIGLPDKWIFPKDSYDHMPEVTLDRLKRKQYNGIHSLQAAGFTTVRRNQYRPLPVYPELSFWLHPGDFNEEDYFIEKPPEFRKTMQSS